MVEPEALRASSPRHPILSVPGRQMATEMNRAKRTSKEKREN
jgi:hypothetical protein